MNTKLDIYGLAEVAKTLGIEKSRVYKWQESGVPLASGVKLAFPEPVAVVSMGPLWSGPEIRELRDLRNRSAGRRRSGRSHLEAVDPGDKTLGDLAPGELFRGKTSVVMQVTGVSGNNVYAMNLTTGKPTKLAATIRPAKLLISV